MLLNTLEPYQREIEHHFTVEGQRRFRGVMAGYLNLYNRTLYLGANLRDTVPFLPKPRDSVSTPDDVGRRPVRAGRAATWRPTASSTPAARRWRTACWWRPTRQGFATEDPGRPGGGGVEDRLAAALRPAP